MSHTKVIDSVDQVLEQQELLSRRTDELIKQTLTAGKIKDKAAALLASDHDAVGQLRKTLTAIGEAIDINAHNLQNANTIGYKALQAKFLAAEQRFTLVRDWRQGRPVATGRQLDLTIRGNGFFVVTDDNGGVSGVSYTRAGSFFTDSHGDIRWLGVDGPRLDPPITVPAHAVSMDISADGVVIAFMPGRAEGVDIGQIQLTQFVNPDGLVALDSSRFVETKESGPPIVGDPGEQLFGTLLQRFSEASNVDSTKELIQIIQLNNWYRGVHSAILTMLDVPDQVRTTQLSAYGMSVVSASE
jgi:flagellar basal body rod protein FlgG